MGFYLFILFYAIGRHDTESLLSAPPPRSDKTMIMM
jgi:hypothetical protein